MALVDSCVGVGDLRPVVRELKPRPSCDPCFSRIATMTTLRVRTSSTTCAFPREEDVDKLIADIARL